MPDMDFYREVYAGSMIPERALREYVSRAQDWLQWLEGCCTVEAYGADSRKMALCAIAETLYTYGKNKAYTQVQTGNLSVRYQKDNRSLQQRLAQSVAGYLKVYRGVG